MSCIVISFLLFYLVFLHSAVASYVKLRYLLAWSDFLPMAVPLRAPQRFL